jgi:catechol 2,3-dioxygenase-like lactoylglutathione lyase family enzyme
MGKLIGIGGVFIKCNDPKKMNEWYKNTLGLTINDYGVLFEFNHISNGNAFLQLGTFPENTDYFGRSEQKYMLNFRVDNLISFLEQRNLTPIEEIAVYEYGKFAHIIDIEGNKIELWEPVDKLFEEEPSNKMF